MTKLTELEKASPSKSSKLIKLHRHRLKTIAEMETFRTKKHEPKKLISTKTSKMFIREIPPYLNRKEMLELTEEYYDLPENEFTPSETSILIQLYHTLAKENGINVGMTKDEFKEFLYSFLQITESSVLDGLARAASLDIFLEHKKVNKLVSLKGFLSTISALLRGSFDTRMELAFEVLDIDTNGLLLWNIEIKQLATNCIDVENPEPGLREDPFEAYREFTKFIQHFFDVGPGLPVTLASFKKIVTKKPWLMDIALPIFPDPLSTCSFEFIFGHPDLDFAY